MTKVVDVKPLMSVVDDVKSSTTVVQDTKPKMESVSGETEVYTTPKTIRVGEPMGLLLAITYPTTLEFTVTRT